jgi:hypothetical protein
VSYLVWKNHVLPGLGDTAIFVGTPFSVHKAAQTLSNWNQNGQGK